MKRILLTGMSGVGKSSVVAELAARGYSVLDMDGWSEFVPEGSEWLWNEDRVQEFLSQDEGELSFICGCARNQVKFYPQFDKIILLSAPTEVILERLETRTNNPYGKHPDDLAEILSNIEAVEPLLRKSAHHEINTTLPLDEVVDTILKLSE